MADLRSELISLRGVIDDGEMRWLVALGEFDAEAYYLDDGYLSASRWLRDFCGLSRAAAGERVRAARQLRRRPRLAAAAAAGALSYSKLRAIARMDTKGNDGVDDVLLAYAAEHTADEIEDLVRAWKIEADAERDPTEWVRRYEQTSLRASVQFNGMGLIELVTTDDEHHELMALIDATVEHRWQREHNRAKFDGLEGSVSSAEAPERADDDAALEGTVSAAEAPPPRIGFPRRRAEAAAELLRIGFAHLDLPDDTSGADRYLLNIDVSLVDLVGNRSAQPTLANGQPIDIRTAIRAACDAAVVRHVTGGAGEPLDIGRKTRVWTAGQRRAVRRRDRHRCRFPGCDNRIADVHHLWHWTKGGPTDVDNGCLLCPAHHRLVHEGGWTTEGSANATIVFTSPSGVSVSSPVPTAAPRRPVAA